MPNTDYDAILYPSATNAGCHTRRHEAVARLFGMQPTPLPSARVLEVGCGDGWNLFPQAEQYPHATFVGFDYASRPIEIGQQVVGELGLNNVELLCADIMQLDASLGEFDYIIAHGFYSWVPEAVRSKFLERLGQWLAPQGVAYISYNVLPGWRTRQVARDLMRYETRGIGQPATRIKAAREAFRFLVENTTSPAYQSLLEQEHDMVRHRPDGYLFHDHLSEINDAYYFHEMLDRMRAAGFDYLGESDLETMYPADLSPEAREKLSELPLEEQEQLYDFLRNREFRGTLFRRGDAAVDRNIGPDRLMPFHVTLSAAARCSGSDVVVGESLVVDTSERQMQFDDPLQQAIVLDLAAHVPSAITCQSLPSRAESRLNQAGIQIPFDRETLIRHTLGFVWQLATLGVVELTIHPAVVSHSVPAYPRVSSTSRYQANHGAAHASNTRHRPVWLEPIMRHVLKLCNGSLATSQIVDVVSRQIEAGEVKGAASDMSQMQAIATLELLAAEGFFISGED